MMCTYEPLCTLKLRLFIFTLPYIEVHDVYIGATLYIP